MDYKPLVAIFGGKRGILEMAANRLQRYVVIVSGYSFKIELINGKDNGNADELSRLPIKSKYKEEGKRGDLFRIC